MEKAEDAGPGYIVRSHGFSACIINPDGSGTDTVYANMSMFADGSCHIECYVDGIRVLSKNIGTEDLMLFQTQDGDSSITAEHVIQKVSITDVDCSGVMLRMTLGRPRTRKGASCYTVYVDNIKGIDGIMPEDRIDIDFGDTEFETLSGFVLDLLGEIPMDDSQHVVSYKNCIFNILGIKSNRATKIKLTLVTENKN